MIKCLGFTLSNDVDAAVNAGDPRLVPTILAAAADFEPIDEDERATMRNRGTGRPSPVPWHE